MTSFMKIVKGLPALVYFKIFNGYKDVHFLLIDIYAMSVQQMVKVYQNIKLLLNVSEFGHTLVREYLLFLY